MKLQRVQKHFSDRERKVRFGGWSCLDSKEADIAGRAASTAAKEALGISPDKSLVKLESPPKFKC